MTTIIENKIDLDNIPNDGYIDHLVLKNNFYSNDIDFSSLIIGKLEIININKYYTKEFNNIIDRVKDDGKLILRNMVFDRLDCSRFDKVKLKGCIILELIKGECKVKNVYSSIISIRYSYYESMNYEKGVYDGMYYINKYDKICRHGFGNMRYSNGSIYYGMWWNDDIYGKGTMKYNDGSVYEGKVYNDKRCGIGIMRYADGSVYEGEWLYDKRWNKGTMIYNDGSIYDGMWKSDKRCGIGIMKYADGNVYEGEWWEDKRWNKGTMRYNDGSVYDGMWKRDKRCGRGIMRYADGNVYDCEWWEDKLIRLN